MINSIDTAGFGKIPPQARDFEEAVLGAIMSHEGTFLTVCDILTADMFYVEAHKYIYEAIETLSKANAPIDLLTVCESLKKAEKLEYIGGAYALAKLTNLGATGDVSYHATIIKQKYINRQIISSSTDTIRLAYKDGGDCFDILDKWRADVIKMDALLAVSKKRDISTITQEAIDEIIQSAQRKGISKYPTYLSSFDVNLSADAGDLIIISGEAGMSKTSFVTDLGRRQAKKGLPFGFMSGEMKDVGIVQRLIAQEGAVNLNEYAKYGINNKQLLDKIYQAADVVSKLPMYISENSGLKLPEIVSTARKWKKDHNIQGLGIDFLQLIKDSTVKTNSRAELIGYVAYALKGLAIELSIPIWLICTLNRGDKKDYGKRPILASLKESGDIEYAADKVVFLYRPEYFGATVDSDGGSVADKCEAIIAKYRGGPLNTVDLRFDKGCTKFYDWDYDSSGIQKEKLIPMKDAIDENSNYVPF